MIFLGKSSQKVWWKSSKFGGRPNVALSLPVITKSTRLRERIRARFKIILKYFSQLFHYLLGIFSLKSNRLVNCLIN